jgi:hypothetical protein
VGLAVVVRVGDRGCRCGQWLEGYGWGWHLLWGLCWR